VRYVGEYKSCGVTASGKKEKNAMTFDEFVEALQKAGWYERNDVQHAHIRELWVELCFKGMIINRGRA